MQAKTVNTSESDAFNRSYINVSLTFQINNTLNATATNFSVDNQTGLTTNATDEQAELLSDFVDEVPGQTKPHIAHAMNASYRGHTQAMREIKKEKPDRGAQMCAEFAEKRMERAVEMFEVGRPEHGQRMLQGYNESMEEAEKAMKIAEKRGLNVTEIAEHVGNMTYKYKHVKEAGTHGKGKGQKQPITESL